MTSVKAVKIENCGNEVLGLTTAGTYTWNVNSCDSCSTSDSKDNAFLKSLFTNTLEPNTICNKYTYALFSDAAATVAWTDTNKASLTQTNGAWTLLSKQNYLPRGTATVYMKATSPSGTSTSIKPIEVIHTLPCDPVTVVTTALNKDQLFYDISLGNNQLYGAMPAQFVPVGNVTCPITFKIETTADSGVTYTAYNDTNTVYSTIAGDVFVNVATSQDRTQYFMTATNGNGVIARIEFHVEVCGSEVVAAVDTNTVTLFVPPCTTGCGVQTISSLLQYYTVTRARCKIGGFTLFSDSAATVPLNNDPLAVVVTNGADFDLNSRTDYASPGFYTVYLKASSLSGKSALKTIAINHCVEVTAGSSLNIDQKFYD